jgi:hypothetical protein
MHHDIVPFVVSIFSVRGVTSHSARLEVPATASAILRGRRINQYIAAMRRGVDGEAKAQIIITFSRIAHDQLVLARRHISKIKSARPPDDYVAYFCSMPDAVAFEHGGGQISNQCQPGADCREPPPKPAILENPKVFTNHFSAETHKVGSRQLTTALAFEGWLPQKGVIPNDEHDQSDDAQTQHNKKPLQKAVHPDSVSRYAGKLLLDR